MLLLLPASVHPKLYLLLVPTCTPYLTSYTTQARPRVLRLLVGPSQLDAYCTCRVATHHSRQSPVSRVVARVGFAACRIAVPPCPRPARLPAITGFVQLLHGPFSMRFHAMPCHDMQVLTLQIKNSTPVWPVNGLHLRYAVRTSTHSPFKRWLPSTQTRTQDPLVAVTSYTQTLGNSCWAKRNGSWTCYVVTNPEAPSLLRPATCIITCLRTPYKREYVLHNQRSRPAVSGATVAKRLLVGPAIFFAVQNLVYRQRIVL
jgi:hypothetical protein